MDIVSNNSFVTEFLSKILVTDVTMHYKYIA